MMYLNYVIDLNILVYTSKQCMHKWQLNQNKYKTKYNNLMTKGKFISSTKTFKGGKASRMVI